MKAQNEDNAFEASLNAISENKIRELSPLSLAYIGDTVYDLYVRSFLVKNRMGSPQALHKQASALVNARAQALAANRVLPSLTEREAEIFRGGKNAKSTPPKNMTAADYKLANALEAVLGYLYCIKDTARLEQLMRIIITASTED